MRLLRSVSPLVEPLSLDEAFVDLAAADTAEHPGLADLSLPSVTAFAEELRARVTEVTGGLTASVGIGTSKFIAKVASDLDKPDGLVVVPPGTERDLLRPMKRHRDPRRRAGHRRAAAPGRGAHRRRARAR